MKSLIKTLVASMAILTAASACSPNLSPLSPMSRLRAPQTNQAARLQQQARPTRRLMVPNLEAGAAIADKIARDVAADVVLTDAYNWGNQNYGYLFGSKSLSQLVWVSVSAETGQATNVSQHDWDPQSQEHPFYAPINPAEWKATSSEQALDLAVKNGFANRDDLWMTLSHWFSEQPLKYVIIPESFQGPAFVVKAGTGEIWPCEGIENGYVCHGRRLTRDMMLAQKARLTRRAR